MKTTPGTRILAGESLDSNGMEETMAAKLAIHERVAEVFIVRWAGQCPSNGGVEEERFERNDLPCSCDLRER